AGAVRAGDSWEHRSSFCFTRARKYQIVLGFATDLSAVKPAGAQHHCEIEAAGAQAAQERRAIASTATEDARRVHKLCREAWPGAGGPLGSEPGSVGAPVIGGCLCLCRSSTLSPAACSRSSCWSRAATARRNSNSSSCATSCRSYGGR